MKTQDKNLIELFWGLQKAGLPLTLQDYYLLAEAWKAGFQPQDFEQLQVLCRRLWVKSLADQQKFIDYFKKYEKTWSDISLQDSISEFIQEQDAESEEQQHTKTDLDIDISEQKQNKTTPEYKKLKNNGNEVGQAVPTLPPNKKIPSGRFNLNQNYFPLNLRNLKQGWRYLRTPQRQGAAKELDLRATIKQVSQQGIFLEPVLRPSLLSNTELVLLIDQSNSMMPFAPLVKQLNNAALNEDHLGDTKAYYFSNLVQDSLYLDSDLLKKQSLSQILTQLRSNRTVVVIISCPWGF
ncbi:MAG: VWA domain-containing protein [Xenococcus sp. MO_188.B8]|nr:VWA domain-containing protein [Xenococcus sp. MO_188.B8]